MDVMIKSENVSRTGTEEPYESGLNVLSSLRMTWGCFGVKNMSRSTA